VTSTSCTTIATILGAMAAVAVIEALVPLHPRGRWTRLHVWPNLALTLVAFATNAVFNGALVSALIWLEPRGVGLLHWLSLPPPATVGLALIGLDLSFYATHVAMHASPTLWRFHCVHHADPAVDVTTTIRQHPGESVIRYPSLAVSAIALGVTPAAFALYRVASVLIGLLEHANIRVPRQLDGALSLVFVTPNTHKVHHSRFERETNTNYGNLTSLFDRLFLTFVPSSRGMNVTYGLAGLDDPRTQSVRGLLALPFRRGRAGAGRAAARRDGFQAPEGQPAGFPANSTAL
jgi:sterol desaturase/sphingolipid hydroxylase (fatty acid hydroxylase superfamily)